MADKLDIFALIRKVDGGDYQTYEKMSEEERKQLSTYMMLRWMSSTSSEYQLHAVNEYLNQYTFSLAKHPDLLLKLAAACSDGSQKRYAFKKYKTAPKKQNMAVGVLMEYYDYSSSDATEALNFFNIDGIIDLATKLGYQDADLKQLKKEMK